MVFGHQSVGRNILSGVTSLEEETGVKLNRVTTRDFQPPGGLLLWTFQWGRMANRVGKIDDFVSIVKAIPAETNAIAFFKLCYVDVVDELMLRNSLSIIKTEVLQTDRTAQVNIQDSIVYSTPYRPCK